MLGNIYRSFTTFNQLNKMSTQYSILSVLIRPEIQEKISIGFLLMNDDKLFFDYSKRKLGIAKNLLSDNAFKSLKDALNNIQSSANKQYSKDGLVKLNSKSPNSFNKPYIEYLSRYNNNILSFTSPKEIELEVSETIFSKLYERFVDNTIIQQVNKISIISHIENFKISKRTELSKHFNIDRKITYNEVPHLIVPVTVTFIGQNEVPTFVQSLDLEKSTAAVTNDISEILFLQNAFHEMNKESVAMAITSEPDKKLFPKQHDIWNQLRQNKDIKNFDISEADAVIDYAVEHNVQPFLEK